MYGSKKNAKFFFTDAAVFNMGKAKSAGKLAAKAAKKAKQEKVSAYCLTQSLRIAELQSKKRREHLRMWMRCKKRISMHCLRNIVLNGRKTHFYRGAHEYYTQSKSKCDTDSMSPRQ